MVRSSIDNCARIALIFGVLVASGGCGEDAQPAPTSAADTTAVDAQDAVTRKPDTAARTDEDVVFTLECPGGADCPCKADDDCDAGLCLETLQGLRCARKCLSACPSGFDCRPYLIGEFSVRICLSRWYRVCDPCQSTFDCQVPGLGGGHCVRYGDAGSFCGVNCESSADCPTGSTCRSVQTVEGKALQQCVRIPKSSASPFGECGCSEGATLRAATTTCRFASQESGPLLSCIGSRKCGPKGLADCAADSDKPLCEDLQCQGQKDGEACDDGSGCTKNDRCEAGKCTPGTFVCACQKDSDCGDDGDLCNGVPICDLGGDKPVCKPNAASIIACNTAGDTDCAKTVCQPQTGQCEVELGDGTACDDGEPCTVGDTCNGKGVCAPGTDTCPCKSQYDCIAKDDGNFCNGTLYCDLTKEPHTCKLNLATVVKCPIDGDTACQKNLCAPKTGVCAVFAAANKAPCDDGNVCTASDHCESGVCVSGTSVCACQTNADCAGKDDGDLCNGVPYCDKTLGKCAPNPASVVTCSNLEDTACRVNSCVPATGDCLMTQQNEGAKCDDGDVCNQGERCKVGVCGGGTSVCSCTTDKECLAFDDANHCNGSLYCDKISGGCRLNPSTVVKCLSEGVGPCEVSACEPDSGKCALGPAKPGALCDDSDKCTVNEVCGAPVGGKSQCGGGVTLCPCTSQADCVKIDDGNPCNGSLFCDAATGGCRFNPATIVTCSTAGDLPCRKNVCVPAFGKCAVNDLTDGTPCSDGSVCTSNAGCVGGVCKAKGQGGCDDGNVCTTDVCDPKTGCKQAPNTANCPDSSACTAGEKCAGGACIIAQPGCDDGAPCTKDLCDPKKGCTFSALTSVCDDGNVCTEDVCTSTAGAGADGLGCLYKHVAAACDDGTVCTNIGACEQGACVNGSTVSCEDFNDCTTDSCDPIKGCSNAFNHAPCEDGDPLTTGDSCNQGACAAGTAPTAELVVDFGGKAGAGSASAIVGLSRNAWKQPGWLHAVGWLRPDTTKTGQQAAIVGVNKWLRVQWTRTYGSQDALVDTVTLPASPSKLWAVGSSEKAGNTGGLLVGYEAATGVLIDAQTIVGDGAFTGIMPWGKGFVAVGRVFDGGVAKLWLHFADASGKPTGAGTMKVAPAAPPTSVGRPGAGPLAGTLLVPSVHASAPGATSYAGRMMQLTGAGATVAAVGVGAFSSAPSALHLADIALHNPSVKDPPVLFVGRHVGAGNKDVAYVGSAFQFDGKVTGLQHNELGASTFTAASAIAVEGDKVLVVGVTGLSGKAADADGWALRTTTSDLSKAAWSKQQTRTNEQRFSAVMWDHGHDGGWYAAGMQQLADGALRGWIIRLSDKDGGLLAR